jgi:hypothetical protein
LAKSHDLIHRTADVIIGEVDPFQTLQERRRLCVVEAHGDQSKAYRRRLQSLPEGVPDFLGADVTPCGAGTARVVMAGAETLLYPTLNLGVRSLP